MVRGQRSRCGTAPIGEIRRLGRSLTRWYGRTTQYPFWIMSAISSSKNPKYALVDGWGPRWILASRCCCVQGGVEQVTGAPSARRCWR